MKTKLFIKIILRVVILFTVAMFATFIPENLRNFFGDKLHHHTKDCEKYYCTNENDMFDKAYDWGIRHYWYHNLALVLFLISVISLILYIIKEVEKQYDDTYEINT